MMNAPQRNPLALAVLAALSFTSGAAHAVYEDPHGQGEVLIYPYYTVQSAGGNSYNTYLSVASSASRPKAVKVRFREGKNARPVLDFNLYLSPNDVWTAAIGPGDGTAASPAVLYTADKSCTWPAIPATGLPFGNAAYAGTNADLGPDSLDRTREGYVEIIEMATLSGPAGTAVTHTVAGTPINCPYIQPANGFPSAADGASLTRPTGGLSGTYTLINVANGLNFGGNATALAQFSATPIFTNPGNAAPDLASANPPVAMTTSDTVYADSGPGTLIFVATYASGRDAVSATMMRSSVLNEFVLDTATRSETDWIITFPTKHLHVGIGTGAAIAPFTNNFGTSGACEPFNLTIFDREELPSEGLFCSTLCPPGPPSPSLCFAASVMSWKTGNPGSTANSSSVVGSQNWTNVSTTGRQNGWARLSFVGVGAATTGVSSLAGTGFAMNVTTAATASNATVNFRGLPAIGFMARTLNNGALSCTTFGGSAGVCAGSYGAAFAHKSQTTPIPAP